MKPDTRDQLLALVAIKSRQGRSPCEILNALTFVGSEGHLIQGCLVKPEDLVELTIGALSTLREMLDQLRAIGVPDWNGAEGLDLSRAEAVLRIEYDMSRYCTTLTAMEAHGRYAELCALLPDLDAITPPVLRRLRDDAQDCTRITGEDPHRLVQRLDDALRSFEVVHGAGIAKIEAPADHQDTSASAQKDNPATSRARARLVALASRGFEGPTGDPDALTPNASGLPAIVLAEVEEALLAARQAGALDEDILFEAATRELSKSMQQISDIFLAVAQEAREPTSPYEVLLPDHTRHDGVWRSLDTLATKQAAVEYAKTTWGADDEGRICLVNQQEDDEDGLRHYVSLPDPDQGPGVWKDIDNYDTRAEAIAAARGWYGADAEGLIQIVQPATSK